MADRDAHSGVVELFIDRVGKMDLRFPFGVVLDLNIEPGRMFAKAGAKGFDDGLFRRKSAGEVGNGIFVLQTIILFLNREEARNEAVAMRLDAFADPLDLDNVVSQT